MKRYTNVLLATVGACAVSFSACAQSADVMNGPMGRLEKSSRIIGSEVKNAQDEKLGRVKDLAVQLGSGRVLEVIVATGGFLDMHEKLIAVPPAEFSYDDANKTLRLNADKDMLKSAEGFDLGQWRENTQDARINQVYQRYNVQNMSPLDQPTEDHRYVERASKIVGMRVHNGQNENLGKIDNLIVDIPSGRVVEVILASGGFLGMGDTLSEVTPQSFQFDAEGKHLQLEASKDTLANAPHFKSSEWPNWNDTSHVQGVYQAYNTPYYGTNQVDNSGQNKRDRNNDTLTPGNQGNNKSDVEVTREIRRQIVATDGLSVDAKNVKIITVNGHVTLRGPVMNSSEKDTINRIAMSVIPADNLDNQLQPKDASVPAASNQ